MTEAEFVRRAVAGTMTWSLTKREAAFVDRARELERIVRLLANAECDVERANIAAMARGLISADAAVKD